MATVNFSVPDEVKEAFDRTFGVQNENAVIVALMRRAVQEAELVRRRMQIFRKLSASRGTGECLTDARLRAQGRP